MFIIGGCNARYEITSGGRVLLLNRSLERACFECFYPSHQFLPDPNTVWVVGAGLVIERRTNNLLDVGIRSQWIDGLLLFEFLNDAIPVDGPNGRLSFQCRRDRSSINIAYFIVSNG